MKLHQFCKHLRRNWPQVLYPVLGHKLEEVLTNVLDFVHAGSPFGFGKADYKYIQITDFLSSS